MTNTLIGVLGLIMVFLGILTLAVTFRHSTFRVRGGRLLRRRLRNVQVCRQATNSVLGLRFQVGYQEDGQLPGCKIGRVLRTVATIVFMKTYSSGLAVDLSADGDLATVVGSYADATRNHMIAVGQLCGHARLGSR